MAGRATSLAFSPLGSHLLAVDSACPGTTVRLVEIYSEDEIIFGKRTGFERVGAAFSNDGSMVAITDGFSEAVFWDAESGRKLITLPELPSRCQFPGLYTGQPAAAVGTG